MKFVADENFPRNALRVLRESGFDVVSIAETQPGIPDTEVLSIASAESRTLLPFDRTLVTSLSVKVCWLRVESSCSASARSRRRRPAASPVPRCNRVSLGPGTSAL